MPKVKTPKLPRVPLNGSSGDKPFKLPGPGEPEWLYESETPLLATESEEAALIAADAEISIPILTGALILLGLLYAAKYILVPLLKLIKVPGSNFFSDFVNKVLGVITSPIKDFLKVILAKIAEGIEAHAEPVTRTLEAGAWALHDLSIELANLAASIATGTAVIVTEIIPQRIDAATKPLKLRIGRVEFFDNQLNAIARGYRLRDFPTLIKYWAPNVVETITAIRYVKSQRHKSLAGALSVYEHSAQRVRIYEETIRKLKFYDVPSWIRSITTTVTKTVPETIKKLALRVGKIENLLRFNKAGIPNLLALMTPAAIGAWFKPAIPEVCTQVGECAASNLLGSNIWKYFKDLLGLLLGLTIGAFALQDICLISRLCRDVVSEIEPEIRSIVVVSGGLASVGCGSGGQTLGPPNY